MPKAFVRRHFWLSYSLLLLALGYGWLLKQLLLDSGTIISRYSPPLFSTLLVLLLAIVLREKAVLNRRFWQGAFRLLMYVTILLLVILGYWIISGSGHGFWDYSIVIAGIILLIPAEQQLYHYAYRLPQLWENPNRRR